MSLFENTNAWIVVPEEPEVVVLTAYTQGPPGPAGPASGFNLRGAYSDASTYDTDDLVVFEGSSYVALDDGVTESPSENPSVWQLVAYVRPFFLQQSRSDPTARAYSHWQAKLSLNLLSIRSRLSLRPSCPQPLMINRAHWCIATHCSSASRPCDTN